MNGAQAAHAIIQKLENEGAEKDRVIQRLHVDVARAIKERDHWQEQARAAAGDARDASDRQRQAEEQRGIAERRAAESVMLSSARFKEKFGAQAAALQSVAADVAQMSVIVQELSGSTVGMHGALEQETRKRMTADMKCNLLMEQRGRDSFRASVRERNLVGQFTGHTSRNTGWQLNIQHGSKLFSMPWSGPLPAVDGSGRPIHTARPQSASITTQTERPKETGEMPLRHRETRRETNEFKTSGWIRPATAVDAMAQEMLYNGRANSEDGSNRPATAQASCSTSDALLALEELHEQQSELHQFPEKEYLDGSELWDDSYRRFGEKWYAFIQTAICASHILDNVHRDEEMRETFRSGDPISRPRSAMAIFSKVVSGRGVRRARNISISESKILLRNVRERKQAEQERKKQNTEVEEGFALLSKMPPEMVTDPHATGLRRMVQDEVCRLRAHISRKSRELLRWQDRWDKVHAVFEAEKVETGVGQKDDGLRGLLEEVKGVQSQNEDESSRTRSSLRAQHGLTRPRTAGLVPSQHKPALRSRPLSANSVVCSSNFLSQWNEERDILRFSSAPRTWGSNCRRPRSTMPTDSLCSSNEGRLFEDELVEGSSREVIEALERRVKILEQDVQDEQGAAHKLKEKLVKEQGKTASLEEQLKRKEIDWAASATLLKPAIDELSRLQKALASTAFLQHVSILQAYMKRKCDRMAYLEARFRLRRYLLRQSKQ